MALPQLTGTARLTADPELRFAPSGVAVCTIQLAFNARRQNKQTGQWEDGDSFFVRGTLFNNPAEHAAESLTKGTEVLVIGRIKTEHWETRDGEKRSTPALLIDSIGPSLRWATTTVNKAQRTTTPADDQEPPF